MLVKCSLFPKNSGSTRYVHSSEWAPALLPHMVSLAQMLSGANAFRISVHKLKTEDAF